MAKYRIISAPATEPITVTEAKNWLKVDYATDDALITNLIKAARERAESYCNTGFITQTVEERLEEFPDGNIILSLSPVISVTSVAYTDLADASATVSADDYSLVAAAPILIPDDAWPSGSEVIITYVIGRGASADDVPAAVKAAMQLMITHWYENRADTVRKMPTQAEYLLNAVREWTT